MNYEIAPDQTPRQLLSQFYEKYNLGIDGGHSDNKVRIEFTKTIYFFLPNWDDRRKALLIHDIHHLITGYKSDFKGETEISSWEIGSNCQHYWAAWILDSYGMSAGFWFNLPGIFRAFVRGRRSKNLYGSSIPTEKALDMTVYELCDQLQIAPIDENLKPNASDIAWFIMGLVLAGLFGMVSILLIPLLILYNIYVFLTLKIANS